MVLSVSDIYGSDRDVFVGDIITRNDANNIVYRGGWGCINNDHVLGSVAFLLQQFESARIQAAFIYIMAIRCRRASLVS